MRKNDLLSAYYDQLENDVPGKVLLTVIDSRQQANSCDLQTIDEKSSRASACLSALGCVKGDGDVICCVKGDGNVTCR